MENIIMIKGKVKFPITLDPGVWIFDDRKIDLNTYFHVDKMEKDELEEYTKEISAHWDREITEGAILPPTIKTEKKFKKETLLSGTFGIPLQPFLNNASPLEAAKYLVVLTDKSEMEFELSTARNFILGFSNEGKPLLENGPIHIYYGDGSNQDSPIVNVKELRVN